jgi:hypothetical protein
MEAQLCKICGVRHHRYEPHQFPDEPAISPEAAIAMPGRAGPAICPEPPPGSARSAPADTATDAPRAKFDRNAYQRAYMRKRRANALALRSKES